MLLRTKGYSAVVLCIVALLLVGCGENTLQDAQGDLSNGKTGLRLVSAVGKLGMNEAGAVEIQLEDTDNLYGLQFSLQFDPTRLQVQDADPTQEGVQIAPGLLPAPDFTVRNVVDNDRGMVDYAVVQLNPREPAAGSGVVATIHFQGVGKGVSLLTFLQAKLADPDGRELPVQLGDVKLEVN